MKADEASPQVLQGCDWAVHPVLAPATIATERMFVAATFHLHHLHGLQAFHLLCSAFFWSIGLFCLCMPSDVPQASDVEPALQCMLDAPTTRLQKQERLEQCRQMADCHAAVATLPAQLVAPQMVEKGSWHTEEHPCWRCLRH